MRYKLGPDDKALADNPAGLTNAEKRSKKTKRAERKAKKAVVKASKKKTKADQKRKRKAIEAHSAPGTTGPIGGSGSRSGSA